MWHRLSALAGSVALVMVIASCGSTTPSPPQGSPTASVTPPSATPIEGASEPSAARYVPPVDDVWRRSSSNPILVATEEWEGQSVERPAVLWEGGTDWKMWYTGGQTWYEGHAAIGFATSTDGIHWTKRGSNPVYGLGASDLTGPAFGTSVVRHAGTYYLYVSGDDGVSVATSADGIEWTTRESSITLPADCDFWGALSVWMDGAVWRMFAVPWHLGLWDTYLYHSADGFNWTIDHDGQPLASLRLHPEGSYSAGWIATVNGVATPWFDGAYHLWYHAVDGPGYTPTNIYHATSTNLIDWTITPRSPVLRHLGTGFEFDQVSFPTVLVVGDLAYLYYTGSDNPAETHAIGVAIGQAIKIPGSLSSPAALPTPTPTPGDPLVGQLAVTVSDRLRVRSQPWVGDDSIKYGPLLPIYTELRVLDGPVTGSGYVWYQVEPLDFTLDGPGYGWVAMAGKDGEPWIGPKPATLPVPAEPTGVTFTTDSVKLPGPTGSDEIPYQVTHTVGWKTPRADGVEIRVYGVTECLSEPSSPPPGTSGPCLVEHTLLPSSVTVLAATVPAAAGEFSWIAPHYYDCAGPPVGPDGLDYQAIVIAAYNAAGHSTFAIAEPGSWWVPALDETVC